MTFSTSSSTCWHYTNTLQFTDPIKFTFFMCFKWIVIKQFFKFLTFLKINPSIEVEPVSHLSKISASRIWQQTRPNTPRVRHYLSTKMYKVCLLLPEAFHTLFFTLEYYRPRYSLFPRVFLLLHFYITPTSNIVNRRVAEFRIFVINEQRRVAYKIFYCIRSPYFHTNQELGFRR